MKLLAYLLIGITSLSLLSACSSFATHDIKRAKCNKLKSDMVFSGATGNTRKSEIEAAEKPLAQHSYDRDDC